MVCKFASIIYRSISVNFMSIMQKNMPKSKTTMCGYTTNHFIWLTLSAISSIFAKSLEAIEFRSIGHNFCQILQSKAWIQTRDEWWNITINFYLSVVLWFKSGSKFAIIQNAGNKNLPFLLALKDPAWKGYGSNYVHLASRELCFSRLYNTTHRASDMILKGVKPVKEGWGRVLWQYISGQISDLIDLSAFVVIMLHTSICHLPVKDHTATPLTAEVLCHCVRSAFPLLW